MAGRQFSTDNYRFGFNGKENDTHWGDQLIQDYGFRLYNPAIGKFLSVDPLSPSYPMLTPYQFASNSPIANIDLDGLEASESVTYKASDGTSITLPSSAEVVISTGNLADHPGATVPEGAEFGTLFPKGTVGAFTINGIEYTAFYNNGDFRGYYSTESEEYYGSKVLIDIPVISVFEGYEPLFDHSEGVMVDPTGGVVADATIAGEYLSYASGFSGLVVLLSKQGLKTLLKSLKGSGKKIKELFERYKIEDINHTATGKPRVKARKGKKRYDITEERVKEFAPEPRSPTGEKQLSFKGKNAQKLPRGTERLQRAKGKKRTPSRRELRLLKKAHKNCPQCNQ